MTIIPCAAEIEAHLRAKVGTDSHPPVEPLPPCPGVDPAVGDGGVPAAADPSSAPQNQTQG